MVVAQDNYSNIFLIDFALVEGEIGGGWSFFLNNFIMHMTLQTNFYLILDIHASI